MDDMVACEWTHRHLRCFCRYVDGPVPHWCGYVSVPPSHPLHGVDYWQFEGAVDVHGGVTFSGQPGWMGADAIGNGVWLVGFDMAHEGDVGVRPDGTAVSLRTETECVSETNRLADQLAGWEGWDERFR